MVNILKNNEGSILVITVGFALIFGMLGIASIQMAGAHNRDANLRISSAKSFWYADGAVEVAKKLLQLNESNTIPMAPLNTDFVMANGDTFDVYSELDPYCQECDEINGCVYVTCADQWLVQAKATNSNQSRAIEARVSNYQILKALQTIGTVKDHGNEETCGTGSSIIIGDCEEQDDFSFEKIFNGLSYSYFIDQAKDTSTKPLPLYYDYGETFCNDDGDCSDGTWPIVEGVTVIKLSNAHKLISLKDNDISYDESPAFLIIDATGVNNAQVSLDLTGGSKWFNGIIWVKGEAKITGNPKINGAVFIEGALDDEVALGGDALINFSSSAIKAAVDEITILTDDDREFVAWNEIGPCSLEAGFKPAYCL